MGAPGKDTAPGHGGAAGMVAFSARPDPLARTPSMPSAPRRTAPQNQAPSAAAAASKGGMTGPQKALQKLGLRRDIDLALHLPLRYEDETRITPLANARDGQMVQIEATVTASEIQLRPRRQLLVQVQDDTGSCELRFFSFYPSHQKTLAVGNRLRIRGEVKGGFWGRQMMHPAFRVAGGELPAALTPVYPTTAGLPQPYLPSSIKVRESHQNARPMVYPDPRHKLTHALVALQDGLA